MRHATANFYPSESRHKEIKTVSTVTVQAQVVSQARDALSRATRQAIQALIPTLLVIAGGSTVGINIEAVLMLAGVAALVSVLKSAVGVKLPASAPTWARIGERALTAAAGTALGLVTTDGLVGSVSIHWETVLTASVGAALTAVAMFWTNPPVVASDDVDDFGDSSFAEYPKIDGDPFPRQRDSGNLDVLLVVGIAILIVVLLLLFGVRLG